MLNNIICKLIKKRTVTFGDILHHMEFYAFIYAELIMIISLTPVIVAIFDPQSFELVALGAPVLIVFVFIPYTIICSIRHILVTVGLYDNIIEMKIAVCPENSEIINTEKNVADDIKEKIQSVLGALIVILMVIYVAEMIYYDVPIEGSVGP